MAQHSASYNYVIDYVPLHEISLIDYEVKNKGDGKDSESPLAISSHRENAVTGASEAKDDLRTNFFAIPFIKISTRM